MSDETSVAVVGLACRVPGAGDAATFWRNVRTGTESIRRFSPDDLRAAGVPDTVAADPAYVPAGGWLADLDRFDAGLFGVPASAAAAMDPQHRIFLECVWSALEDAGCVPEQPHRTGLFAAASSNDWLIRLLRDRELVDAIGLDQALLGTEKDYLVSRVAYTLGLSGPALAVQTACSSSLAAVHLAARSLLTLECDVAVAGGVSVTFVDPVGYRHEPGGIRSPDGRCRAFDANANGTVAGNGVGVVVLKRLADALADGDTVRAVVSGTAMNNDGRLKVGFTAPSVRRQAEVIAEALAVADAGADTVDYVEAHGTGTAVGDPIELTALGEVFGGRPATDPVLVGSVKPNIGHLDAASGVVGLIKTVLAVEAALVPATINLRTPTGAVDWTTLGVTPNTAPRPWPVRVGRPRRAGVSSFGIGGTNVHVVVESAEVPDVPAEPTTAEIVTVSGADDAAVDRGIIALCDHAGTSAGPVRLRDLAATTRTGRTALASRAAVVCRSADELAGLEPGSWIRGHADVSAVVFLFPGQDSWYPGAGSGLAGESLFRAGDELPVGDDPLAGDEARLFVLEYTLARLWQLRWGVRPLTTVGCGVGEFVSACLAGVLTPADALRAVTERGRLLRELPDRAVEEFTALMAGVPLSPPDRPFVSTVTGGLLDPDRVADPEYWGGQLRAPVRFADAVTSATTLDGSVWPLFVEVGPGAALTARLRHLRPDAVAVPSLPAEADRAGPADDRTTLLSAVAAAWANGAPVDWTGHGRARKIPLPTYPFARERYWPDRMPRATSQAGLYLADPVEPGPVEAVPADRSSGGADEVTEFLLESWRTLLGVPDVTGDSDFFELGGESLLAIRLTEGIRRRFGVPIPPTQLFSTSTVDTLAVVVRGGTAPEDDVVADLVADIARMARGPADG
ncbi:hypothetical protein BLA60_04740 [Actinophytocola xinjiangensis]|uniref:Acyl transferase domain-containing protein n=1 Tax=Actinophytocola xinjiangensis TaxID=485602 RepID=A0A7Z0WSE2_9PSEU|nr:beta-ketoacyl synthase N-terminal-like domain-containing protein [Actinophytocola xinjiangensis]OLF14430.1 hypothetical protein BLA60_04740 [Actinophytocola xinjiangensis]